MTIDTTLIEQIEKKHFAATEDQIEALAAARAVSATDALKLDGAYFKIVIVKCQAQLGTKTRGRVSAKTQEHVLETVSGKCYAAVLRGVTTPDIAADPALDQAEQTRRRLERNSRSNFARTAKTTILGFIRGGGDLRAIKVHEVTKESLRTANSAEDDTDPVVRRVNQARVGLVRGLKKLLGTDPKQARMLMEQAVSELQGLLQAITAPVQPVSDMGATTTVVGRTRGRPSREPRQLHRSA